VRLRGAFTAIDNKTVTIATREGTTVNISRRTTGVERQSGRAGQAGRIRRRRLAR